MSSKYATMSANRDDWLATRKNTFKVDTLSSAPFYRWETNSTTVRKVRDFSIHTIRICTNQNVFDGKYWDYITFPIIKLSIRAYLNAYSANEIVANNEESFTQRIKLQRKCIKKLNDMLGLIELAKFIYGLKTPKVVYWHRMGRSTLRSVEEWSKSDIKNFHKGDA